MKNILSPLGWDVPPGPSRVVALNQFIAAVGFGAFLAGSAIMFVRLVGLTPAQVGTAMSIAGAVGLLATVPVGRLADRMGPRGLSVTLNILEAVAVSMFLVVRDVVAFTLVMCAMMLIERASGVIRNALLIGILGREGRVRIKAVMRSLFNAGFSVGALIAGGLLQFDAQWSFVALIVIYAGSMVLTATITCLKLPPVAAARNGIERPVSSARDYWFMSVAALCGMSAIHQSVLSLGVPLWILTQTDVPKALVGLLFVLNTVIVIGFQVMAARQVETLSGAGRWMLTGCLLLAIACGLLALSQNGSVWVASGLVVAAVIVITVAEMWMSASVWTFSFELSDPRAPGEYQGMFALGMALEAVVGPLMAVTIFGFFGTAAWFVLATYFVCVGLALGAASRSSARHLSTSIDLVKVDAT